MRRWNRCAADASVPPLRHDARGLADRASREIEVDARAFFPVFRADHGQTAADAFGFGRALRRLDDFIEAAARFLADEHEAALRVLK